MNPLKVKASTTPITSAVFSGLQPLTNAEVQNYIANVITTKFATDTTGSGTAEINITTDNSGSGTSIGTFSDTDRTEATGTHPATGAVDTVTYYAKQVTTAVAENVTARPVAWSDGVRQMTDSDLDGVLDTVISAFVAESTYTAGQYKLQATAPSGGTWQARYTITDVANGGNTTTYLWQKTAASTSPSDFLAPLKSNDANSVKIMTAAEVEQLVPNFRNRIIDTNIGTYKLQASAPVSGTWVEFGSSTTDTREEISPLNYVGNYVGNYSGTYGGPPYTAFFTSPAYSQVFSDNYVGTAPYSGTYAGVGPSYSGNFSGNFSNNFTGLSYSNPAGNNPAGPSYSTPGNANPAGPSYSTPGNANPGGPSYSNPAGPSYSNPAGNNPAGPSYSTPYTGSYGGNYDGPPPQREQIVYYSGPTFAGTYTGVYSGPGLNYEGYFEIPIAPFEPGEVYIGYFAGAPQNYIGYYASGIGYVANFQGPSLYFVTGYDKAYYSGTYLGPPSYSTPAGSNPAGPSYSNPAGPSYSNPGGSNPSGPSYSNPGGSNPAGPSYSNPAGNNPAGPSYSGTFTGNFIGNFTGNFTSAGNFTGNYVGPATYTGNYTGNFSSIYTNIYGGNFTGNYSGTYAGTYSGATIVSSKETVSTIKLWIRTA